MTPEHQEYRRRKAEQEAKYKNKRVERWFSWWRNPSDRFAALVAMFTALLFAATVGLYLATKDLVLDARMSGRAWLGPVNASIESPMLASQNLRMIVSFGNTGKEPALFNSAIAPKIYSLQEWNNGVAADEIVKQQVECMKA